MSYLFGSRLDYRTVVGWICGGTEFAHQSSELQTVSVRLQCVFVTPISGCVLAHGHVPVETFLGRYHS